MSGYSGGKDRGNAGNRDGRIARRAVPRLPTQVEDSSLRCFMLVGTMLRNRNKEVLPMQCRVSRGNLFMKSVPLRQSWRRVRRAIASRSSGGSDSRRHSSIPGKNQCDGRGRPRDRESLQRQAHSFQSGTSARKWTRISCGARPWLPSGAPDWAKD